MNQQRPKVKMVVRVAVVVRPDPPIHVTSKGFMSEAEAAQYLSHHMRSQVTPRTLRYWRREKQGPLYHKGQEQDRRIWYRKEEIDAWLEDTAIDPLAA